MTSITEQDLETLTKKELINLCIKLDTLLGEAIENSRIAIETARDANETARDAMKFFEQCNINK